MIDASIKIKWDKKIGPDVKIDKFENLSPGKLEKCFEATMKEWCRLRAVSIGERRVRDIKERAGAENG